MKGNGRKQLSDHEKKRLLQRFGIFATILLILIVICGVLLRQLDQKQNKVVSEDSSDIVEINGVKCRPNDNIKTYLILGTDDRGKIRDKKVGEDEYGQCDTVMLVVLDQAKDTYRTLTIDRNTMTEVEMLDLDNESDGSDIMQICLSHAYGDGFEGSGENTVNAVSKYLYGQKIHGYAAYTMDIIGILNHEAGGVTVTIKDDLTADDPSLILGETITLSDEQAVNYVHGRMNVADGTNANRMSRQKEYLDQLEPILRQKCQESTSFASNLYEGLEDYTVTSLSKNEFSKLVNAAVKYEKLPAVSIEGETIPNAETGIEEFYPDENSVADAVIELFYTRVE